jgi:hypothetical protein
MEQKNTIVKCARHNCLWNHCGTCDQYVIPIGVDGQCGAFVETAPKHEEADAETLVEAEGLYQYATEMLARQGVIIIPSSSEPKRGQRAKCNFYEDGWADPEIVKEACQPFTCDMMDVNDKHLGEDVTVKIPDPKDMGIHFTIQNTQWNKEFLRDQMCWYCDNGIYGECKLTAKPALDRTGKCPYYKSTGGEE